MDKETQNKVFNEWFQIEKKLGHKGAVGGQLVCTVPSLAKYINKLHRTFSFKINAQDFMAESAYQIYLALGKFEVQDGELEDPKNQSKLFAYVKRTLSHQAIRFSNPETLFTTTTVDGKKTHIKLTMEVSSLDIALMEEEPTTLKDLIPNEANLFGTKEGYKATQFNQWFQESKEEFLTERELHLLATLPRYINDNGTYSMEQFKETGIQNKHLKRTLDRIKEKTHVAYQNSKEIENMNPIKEYLELIDKEDTTDKDVLDWLLDAMEITWFATELQKRLSQEQEKELIRFYQSEGATGLGRSLYAVNEAIVDWGRESIRDFAYNKVEFPAQPISLGERGIVAVDAFGVFHSY